MLAISVHEQHGAEAGMIEAGEQRRLLAEIARQRHHLHVERIGRQRMGDAIGVVLAAVIDIDDFHRQVVFDLERARDLADALVQQRAGPAASL